MKNLKKLNCFNFIGLMCLLVMIFTFVEPNAAQAEVNQSKVNAYEKDLQNLDIDPKASGNSIIAAKDLFFKTFTEQDSPETRDAAFFAFYKYYLKIEENAYKDEIYRDLNSEFKEDNHPEVIKARKIIASQGLKLVMKEATYEPDVDANYLAKTFQKFISPSVKAYLAFTKSMENIEIEKQGETIILGESVIKKYPNSKVAPLVKPQLNDRIDFYILGNDINPVYDWSDKKILPELKSSYEKFLKENQSSTYYSLVKYAYHVWKQNNFKYNKKVYSALLAKLRKDGILPMPSEN